MLREVWSARTGQSGWGYLWSPYWGQRPLLPRLLILLSLAYLKYSTLPFIVINMAAQFSTALILISLARQLFPGRPNRLFWISWVAIVNLLLSSLQMEAFIEGIEIQYTIGYASAVGAITVLGVTAGCKFAIRFWFSIFLGLVSSACLAVGLFVWPILIFQVLLARRGGSILQYWRLSLQPSAQLTRLVIRDQIWAWAW